MKPKPANASIIIDERIPSIADLEDMRTVMSQQTATLQQSMHSEMESLRSDFIDNQRRDAFNAGSSETISAGPQQKELNEQDIKAMVIGIIEGSKPDSNGKGEIPLDRPTKNLITSINDKLIRLAKTQEHGFESYSQRLIAIEKKISKPTLDTTDAIISLKAMISSLDSRLIKGDIDRQLESQKLEKKLSSRTSNSALHDDMKDEIQDLKSEFKKLNQSWKDDSSTNQKLMILLSESISDLKATQSQILLTLRK